VITNAELDHHTTYDSLRDVLDTFAAFAAKADEVVLPGALRDRLGGRGHPYEGRFGDVRLAVPGEHNRANAAAALVACELAGADMERAVASLADFSGAGRRFERVGETDAGAIVVDDYAHHPTEVAATIAAARSLEPAGRIVALFQPHLYSRTQAEARNFGAALAAADLAVVTGIYPARERAEDFPGITALLVAEAAADAGGTVAWMPALADAERYLRSVLRAGDLCLTLGAGDVDSVGRALAG
jgi:UDP-N-acetylmuramate--alanine ligase